MRAFFQPVSNSRLAVVRSVFRPPREHDLFLEQDIYIFDFVVLRLGPEQTKKRDHAEGVPLPLPSLSGACTGRILQPEKPDDPFQGCSCPRSCFWLGAFFLAHGIRPVSSACYNFERCGSTNC